MISATILTHNSAKTIALTLKSLKGWVTDLVVVDDTSTDETISIINDAWPDARVFRRSLDNNFADQRNFSLEQCRHDWVVIIDSDEEITQSLKTSILAALASPGAAKAFCCWRRNFNFAGSTKVLLNRPILQRKDLAYRFAIHESVDAPLTKIAGELLHHSWGGTEDFINEINRYSTWKAGLWIAQGRHYSRSFVITRQIIFASYIFLKRMLFERRILAGWKGLLYCIAWSVEELFVAMKYLELTEEKRPTCS